MGLLVLGTDGRAGIINPFTSARLTGDDLNASAVSALAQHDLYGDMLNTLSWQAEFTNHKVAGQVRAGIDQSNLKLADAYEYTFHVTVKYFTYNFSDSIFDSTTVQRTLFISYDPLADNKYVDLALIEFEDAHRLVITVDSIIDGQGTDVLAGTVVEPHAYIEAWVLVERYYAFDPTYYLGTATVTSTVTADNLLRISWDPIQGAEEYDLEWTYVDDYSGVGTGGSIDAQYLNYDFRFNSTRVTLTTNSYDVAVVYEKGYVLYRVRGVGRKGASFQYRMPGKWTSEHYDGSAGGVGTFGHKHQVTSGSSHEVRLNWQYTATYAEEGKRKEVIGYFDGSLRNRQNVTRINSEDSITIAGETIYDHQGRPAVSILPVPTGIKELMYNRSFNVSEVSSKYYDRLDFDTTFGGCTDTVVPLKITTGAGMYYSSAASDTTGHQGYVPDAYGYPFTVTEYTADNTGRIRRQSGVGPDHKLSTGHETRYFYGSPYRTQLDRLFGTEIGYAHHYKKVMVVDPNGQVSVTYTDLAGKTIATSLAGDTLEGLFSLPSDTFDRVVTEDLIVKNKRQLDSLVVVYPILVTSTGQHQFAYEVTPMIFDYCSTQDWCSDCVYDLTISVKDECGVEMLPYGPVTDTVGVADGLCASLATLVVDDTLLLIDSLPVGQFWVTKTLALNSAAIEYYADEFLKHDTCLKTLDDFIRDQLDSIDFSLCHVDGCEVTCLDSLGPKPGGGAALVAWLDSLKDCKARCNSLISCDVYYEAMLHDLNPGGQYALYDTATFSAAAYPLSVLNWNNNLRAGHAWWKYPTTPYRDEFGKIDTVLLSNGNRGRPEQFSTLKEFVKAWKPSWAKSLVAYHPEYCYYERCLENMASELYDYKMQITDTYEEAFALGLLIPVNGTGCAPSFPGMTPQYDPYFAAGGLGNPGWLLGDIKKIICDYYHETPGVLPDYTIWKTAIIAAHCPKAAAGAEVDNCLSSNIFGSDSCKDDLVWETFRALYMSAKLNIQEQERRVYAVINKCWNRCIGDPGYDSTDFGCWNLVGVLDTPNCPPPDTTYYHGYRDEDQPCSHDFYADYAGKYQVFPNVSDALGYSVWGHNPSPGSSYVNNTIPDLCADQCETFADYWMFALSGCDSFTADTAWQAGEPKYDSVRQYLIEICELGCDEGHPFGASTTPPGVSTSYHAFTSFQAVLTHFIGVQDTALCDALLISFPKPYGDYWHGGRDTFPEMDTCACDLILETAEEWDDLASPPSGITNLEDYFLYKHGIVIPHIHDKICICYDAQRTGGGWDEGSVAYLDSVSAWVPFEITCPKCVTCDSVRILLEGLYFTFNFDSLPDHEATILANYLNDTLNFSRTPIEYLRFLEFCDLLDTNSDCGDQFSPDTDALMDFFNELLDLKRLGGTQISGGGDTVAPLYLPSFLNSSLNFTGDPSSCWRYEQWWVDNPSSIYDTLYSYLINTCTRDTCKLWIVMVQRYVYDHNTDQLLLQFVDLLPDPFDPDHFQIIFSFTNLPGGYDTVSGYASCFLFEKCDTIGILCDDDIIVIDTNDCERYLMEMAVKNANVLYQQYIDSVKNDFITKYTEHCLSNSSEVFNVTYDEGEYHYTLYYYDRAGNLVRTVPPEGVRPLSDQDDLDHVIAYRAARKQGVNIGRLTPEHELVTQYLYTSYNQVRWQSTPDGGETVFWYDRLGRIAASQNAKQLVAETPLYSYTTYDALGRINEVGQIMALNDPTQAEIDDWPDFPGNFGFNDHQVTRTNYDNALATLPGSVKNNQKNLRGRVTSTVYDHDGDGNYEHGTHYTYDFHGNVSTLWQEFTDMAARGIGPPNGMFKMSYDYDLVSGNVNEVTYQKGLTDYFAHRYTYDADNRITEAKTGSAALVFGPFDGALYSTDARYRYYKHGPLARTELGEHQVQGIDYAYTLHGWIKGVNSNMLGSELDIGKDGSAGDAYNGVAGYNKRVAKDAFSYSLHYYASDYTPINGRHTKTTQYWLSKQSGSSFASASVDLFNGNIPRMVTNIMDETETVTGAQGTAYTYDVLNRLRSMHAYAGLDDDNDWNTASALSAYHTRYTYDGNGNITSLVRRGYDVYVDMDSLDYHYYAGTNRLEYVNDAWGTTPLPDIDNQSSGNYTYDPIGNLISDASESIDNITWTVYGKIESVVRATASDSTHLLFSYGSDGNRVRKITVKEGTTDTTWTWYVRDAQGNVMAIYSLDTVGPADTLRLKEHYVYGSSRLGYVKKEVAVLAAPELDSFTRVLGCMNYELSNHLGNVLAVVSDQKIPVDETANDSINYFLPNVLAWSDFYPFGMIMPGRSGGEDYRHGFNGKEHDPEVSGTGNQYDYGFRIYNPRLGKFLSVDPLFRGYPWNSPYAFAENRVIDGIDLDGLEYVRRTDAALLVGTGVMINLENLSRGAQRNYKRATEGVWGTGGRLYYQWTPGAIGVNKTIGLLELDGSTVLTHPAGQPRKKNPNEASLMVVDYEINGQKPEAPQQSSPVPANHGDGQVMAPARGNRAAAVIIGAINMVNLIRDVGSNFLLTTDRERIESDFRDALVPALKDVNVAMKIGIIPPEMQNLQDLGKLVGIVYSGNYTGDSNIDDVGMQILKEISKNFNGLTPQQMYPSEPHPESQAHPENIRDNTRVNLNLPIPDDKNDSTPNGN